jgi:hypothetical protein
MGTYAVLDKDTQEVIAIGDAANLGAARAGASRIKFDVHIAKPEEIRLWGAAQKPFTDFAKPNEDIAPDPNQLDLPIPPQAA